MSTSSCQRLPSTLEASATMKPTSCDDSIPSTGSKRQLDTLTTTTCGSSIKARKRHKVELPSKPTDSSVCLSKKTSQTTERKSYGKHSKSKSAVCCKIEEKDEVLGDATAPSTASTAELKRLQTSTKADASGRIAKSTFHEGDAIGLERSPQGISASRNNASWTKADSETIFNKPLGAELCFGDNVWR
jgi:hypothetical protein